MDEMLKEAHLELVKIRETLATMVVGLNLHNIETGNNKKVEELTEKIMTLLPPDENVDLKEALIILQSTMTISGAFIHYLIEIAEKKNPELVEVEEVEKKKLQDEKKKLQDVDKAYR